MTPIIYIYPHKIITGKFPPRLPSIAGTARAKSQATRQKATIILWKPRPSGDGGAA